MDYAEAKKQVQELKVKDNFMLVTLSYDNTLVLPYKDGLAFMASMLNAECLEGSYSSERIIPLGRNQQKISIMSSKEYERFKIAALLNVSISDVEQLEKTQ